jgi:hypothetical protein
MVGCLHKGCSQKYHYVCSIDKGKYLFVCQRLRWIHYLFINQSSVQLFYSIATYLHLDSNGLEEFLI